MMRSYELLADYSWGLKDLRLTAERAATFVSDGALFP